MNSNAPAGYNATTLFYWLWWKLNCYEATPSEFQRLFERVATRIRPDFIKVRPYGNIGDRKCDGLYWGNGTVFQVYSPDELKQAEAIAKIDEDLTGAVAEWGNKLKKWVFVYNTRRGLAPDIPRILYSQQEKYPNIIIEPLSTETIWKQMRELKIQQLAEILGAPPGYEHIFLLPGTVSKEIDACLKKGRFVIIQDVLSPINIQDTVKALKPEKLFGPPFLLHTPSIQDSWELAFQYQEQIIEEVLNKSRDLLPRFAVFSLAPIPLAIHLGYLLSDRVEVLPFQFDRDRKTWCWDEKQTVDEENLRVEGLPDKSVNKPTDVVIRVSLSAQISPDDTIIQSEAEGDVIEIDLFVDKPNVMWLCHSNQLKVVSKTFRDILQGVINKIPNCRKIHLYYAGPTGGAVVIGQTINPRMYPPIELYEYNRRGKTRYQKVKTLE